jgi:hypothetical protein
MLQVLSTLDHGRNFDNISEFDNEHVLHIFDVFDQQYVDQLLKKGSPKYVVNDHFGHVEFDGLQIITLPLYIEQETRKVIKDLEFDDQLSTSNCFNFIINKKQINRFLCIKLVELFNLTDYDYTWSGVDQNFDMSYVIEELNQLGHKSPLSEQAKSFILEPIRLEKKFFHFNKNNSPGNSSVRPVGGISWIWQNGMQELFSKSAISLITESVSIQKGSVFTEKTLFAVLGLTFPIWVGGYNQAQQWARLGFDTFDDVIDHSYQTYDTLVERCYYAVAKNIELLSNLSKTQQLRQQNLHRLLKNRNILLNNGLSHFVDQQVLHFPSDLQQVMPDILKHFRDLNQ